jgi:hypothetical protein
MSAPSKDFYEGRFPMKERYRPITTVVLIAAIMTTAMPSVASARHRLHRARFAKARLHVRPVAEDKCRPVTALPPMRYYGGPKSPMWRG